MVSDRVGDFIVRLQNAGAVGKREVALPYSAHLDSIARSLQKLGYVAEVDAQVAPAREGSTSDGKKMLTVTLAYDPHGKHKIHGVKRISKPGRRLYVSSREAHGVKNGAGARIISTPKGILSDKEARRVRAGGENLFEIW